MKLYDILYVTCLGCCSSMLSSIAWYAIEYKSCGVPPNPCLKARRMRRHSLQGQAEFSSSERGCVRENRGQNVLSGTRCALSYRTLIRRAHGSRPRVCVCPRAREMHRTGLVALPTRKGLGDGLFSTLLSH